VTRCEWTGDERLRRCDVRGAQWLQHVALWRPDVDDELPPIDGEAAVVLLSGTFDLLGNGTSWPARGARKTPLQGRPMAVYLPPKATFAVRNAPAARAGEILLVYARQPAVEAEPEGRDALSSKPLLPLAGSGKAFDPKTGEWKPEETFPTAAESLPPRRFERVQVGELVLERVFASDYKAATLCLDEVVVPAGASLRLGDVPSRPGCDELLVFTRRSGEHGGDGDEVQWLSADDADALAIDAADGATYVAIAYAGKR